MARRGRKKKTKITGRMFVFMLVIVVLLVIGLGIFYYLEPIKFKEFFGIETSVDQSSGNNASKADIVSLSSEDCSIHFMELGNGYSGDAILVKVGNTEVLIDAGSKTNSIDTISAYIDKYCTDNVIEYVIVTHAHEDHIACFGGTTSDSYRTIFDRYECQTIIDFPLSSNQTKVNPSKIYLRYINERDAEVANGANHYTALECYNNANGAQRIYNLGGDTTLEILYNYYYDHTADDENNYSVCCMITDGDDKFLLTGDLESCGKCDTGCDDECGEGKLIQYNNLGEVTLFKAGHHGSYSSSSDNLLKVIKPKVVVFTAVMGSDEYTDNINNMFPSYQACKNVVKYTSDIYITSCYNATTDTDEAYNGNIVVVSNSTGYQIYCSNKTDKMTECDWYKTYRSEAIPA